MISLNTYQPQTRIGKSFLTDIEPILYRSYLVGQQTTESVFVNFYGYDEFVSDFSDSDLTALSMESSEKSFTELWDLEDDDYWNSYLKD